MCRASGLQHGTVDLRHMRLEPVVLERNPGLARSVFVGGLTLLCPRAGLTARLPTSGSAESGLGEGKRRQAADTPRTGFAAQNVLGTHLFRLINAIPGCPRLASPGPSVYLS